jgi:hypothetical protein
MGVISFFRNIYDLDTLDTRFTVKSNTPYKTVIEARNDTTAASKERAEKWNSRSPTSSKWKTPEFFLYYGIFIFALPYMFRKAYSASQGMAQKPDLNLTCNSF